jgi:hypothetical protein
VLNGAFMNRVNRRLHFYREADLSVLMRRLAFRQCAPTIICILGKACVISKDFVISLDRIIRKLSFSQDYG